MGEKTLEEKLVQDRENVKNIQGKYSGLGKDPRVLCSA